MYTKDWKRLWQYVRDHYGQHSIFSTEKHSQVSSKITNLRHHISKGNVILCRKDRHPLLLKYFITFLRYIRMIGRDHGILWKTLYGQYSIFSTKKHSQLSSKISNLGHQVSPSNVTLCREDRHPLLLECFITFLWYMKLIWRAYGVM